MIMFGAVIAISQTFVEVGGPLVPGLLSEMPTFFDYSSDIEMTDANDGPPNERLQLYYLLVLVAAVVLIILGMLAGIAWFAEDFNLMQPGTAFKIITKVIVFLPFFMIFPYVWDLYAVSIENASLFLMDPFGSSDPSTRSQILWQSMGSVLPPDAFDIGSWGAALADPGTAGQALLKNVFLALFRGIAVMMMTAMMFVLSAVRLVLTSVLIIALPLILVLGLVPFFKKATTLLTDNLIGLSIAPIFSAIVLTAGLAYLDSTHLPAMQDWFSTLAVGFLAVFFPIFLSPMLGQMATHVGQAMQTAMQSAATISGTGIQGMAQGMASASSAMDGAGVNMMGNVAGAGIGAVGKVSSLGLGQATSGMGGFEKFKILAKGALTGAAAGTAAGAINSAGSIAGNPEMSRYTARSVMSAGQVKAFEIGQMGMANFVVRNVHHNMLSMETSVNSEIVSSSFGSSDVPALMVSNPGGMIHSMETPSLLDLPQAQQELLAHQQQNIRGFDQMSPSIQEKTTAKLVEQIKQHPQSASHMLNEIKLGSSDKTSDEF